MSTPSDGKQISLQTGERFERLVELLLRDLLDALPAGREIGRFAVIEIGHERARAAPVGNEAEVVHARRENDVEHVAGLFVADVAGLQRVVIVLGKIIVFCDFIIKDLK